MGSKNRIHLGIIIDFILHFHRNFYVSTKIYMSKRVQSKIKEKHNNIFSYTSYENFQILLNSTIASVGYDKCNSTINFISYIKEENLFILYSLKKEKNHTACNTIFTLNSSTLKRHYKREDFKLFKKNLKDFIESYMTN